MKLKYTLAALAVLAVTTLSAQAVITNMKDATAFAQFYLGNQMWENGTPAYVGDWNGDIAVEALKLTTPIMALTSSSLRQLTTAGFNTTTTPPHGISFSLPNPGPLRCVFTFSPLPVA